MNGDPNDNNSSQPFFNNDVRQGAPGSAPSEDFTYDRSIDPA
jgi:hypothetical protein